MPLTEFLPANLFAAFLIFARIGATMMLLPGFGEVYVPQRYRLLLALVMAALLTPVLAPVLPPLPDSPARLAVIVGGEIAVGVFIGTVARILVAALETAGTVVSLQLGLSAAAMFNPLGDQQDEPAAERALRHARGGADLPHRSRSPAAARRGRELWRCSRRARCRRSAISPTPWRGSSAGSFRLGIEMAAPFIVLGLVFFVALGLIARMVPQLQVLFIAQPLQIIGGLFVFAVVLVTGMRWFLDEFVQQFALPRGELSRWPRIPTTAKKPKNRPSAGCSARATEGQVAQSREINTWFMLATSGIVMLFLAPSIARRLDPARSARSPIRRAFSPPTASCGRRSWRDLREVVMVAWRCRWRCSWPPRSAGTLVQIGFVFATDKIGFDLSRISPVGGVRAAVFVALRRRDAEEPRQDGRWWRRWRARCCAARSGACRFWGSRPRTLPGEIEHLVLRLVARRARRC